MFFAQNARLMRDVYLGLCFMVAFIASNGYSSVMKTLTTSIEKDDPSNHVDGYLTSGIGYTAIAFGMWFSPGLIASIGPKNTMVLGTISFLFFTLTLLTEQSLWIYLSSAISGFGGSLLWTGQATYIVLNSEIGKVYSGIGVFWILYQSSHIFGNLIIYLFFNDVNRSIDKSMRMQLELILSVFNLIAVLMMLAMRPPLRNVQYEKIVRSPIDEMLKSFRILSTPVMMLLIASMVSVGLHLSFLSILSVSMGFTTYLSENSKELAPLCGLVQGFGEMFGGILSIAIGGRRIFKMRSQMTSAALCNLVCYIIAFLALPNEASKSYTDSAPIVMLPSWILVFAAALSGVGDACLHTEIYDFLGTIYPNDSASAFAAFKFIRCIATASAFYYTKYLGLYTQLIILIAITILSWICYHYVQWFLLKTTPTTEDQPDEAIQYQTKKKYGVENES